MPYADPEIARQKAREYRLRNPERVAEIKRRSNEKHKAARAAAAKAWKEKNREHLNRYHRDRRANNPDARLAANLYTRLRNAIRNGQKGGSAVKDLGCSITELRIWLESHFSDEMSWENYGIVWEIDHILPMSEFNLVNSEEVEIACHYTNLQPLPIHINRSKGAFIQ